jgi:hypothetical protein
MSSRHRIVTPHLVKRTALRELARLRRVQAAAKIGDGHAQAELDRLEITAETLLVVRKEDRRILHWAVAIHA